MKLIAYFTATPGTIDAAAERVDQTLESPETYVTESRAFDQEEYTVLEAEAWFVMAVIGELANDGNDCLFNVEPVT